MLRCRVGDSNRPGELQTLLASDVSSSMWMNVLRMLYIQMLCIISKGDVGERKRHTKRLSSNAVWAERSTTKIEVLSPNDTSHFYKPDNQSIKLCLMIEINETRIACEGFDMAVIVRLMTPLVSYLILASYTRSSNGSHPPRGMQCSA